MFVQSKFLTVTGFLTWWILMTTSQMETRAGWEAQQLSIARISGMQTDLTQQQVT